MENKHAWFSEESKNKGHGTVIYLHEDGTEVEATLVSDDKDTVFLWADKKYLGLVTKWLREGLPDTRSKFR